jgi:hypothetical protein
MERLSDFTRQIELRQRAAAAISEALSRDSFLCADAGEFMARRGALRHVKATDALLASDVAMQPANAAFLAVVDQRSILGALPGAVRVPLNTTARLQVGELAGGVVAEGDVLTNGTLSFDEGGAPLKIVNQVVVSSEFALAVDPATQDALTNILAASAAKATDVQVIAALTAGSPAASADPGVLLAALGRPSAPVLVGGYDALLGLDPGRVRDLQALGVSVIPCAAAAGVLIALDQAGLLISAGGIEVATARHASVTLDGTTQSLWQRSLIALRGLRMLRLAVRAGAVAFASVGSPA